MYVKFLIVSLLPIALARHILYGRPGLWTHVDPGRQFHFRNPDSENFGVQGTQFRQYGTNFGDFGPYHEENHDGYEHNERYADHNIENAYRHGNVQQTDQDVRNIEHTDFRNSEYQIQNDNKKETQRYDNNDRGESYHTKEPLNSNQSGNRKNHQANSNNRERSRTIDHTQDNRQGTLKTNIDSQTSTYSESLSDGTTKYHSEDVTSSYDPKEYVVPINEDAKSVKPVPIDQSSVVHSSVPETNFKPRVANAQGTRDNLPEVNDNGDSMIFADNPKPITSVKTTTDNEVRFSKSEGNIRKEDEKWIWMESHPSTTTAPVKKPSTGADLDDRVALAGDGCPKGEAKVLGQCVKKHK